MATHIQSQRTDAPHLLRRALQADGVLTGIGGIICVAASGWLSTLLGVTAPLLITIVGVVLLGCALALFYMAAQEPIGRKWAIAIVVLDALWVLGSVVVLVTGWLPLTATGRWVVTAQAIIVALLADLQFVGIWRAR